MVILFLIDDNFIVLFYGNFLLKNISRYKIFKINWRFYKSMRLIFINMILFISLT